MPPTVQATSRPIPGRERHLLDPPSGIVTSRSAASAATLDPPFVRAIETPTARHPARDGRAQIPSPYPYGPQDHPCNDHPPSPRAWISTHREESHSIATSHPTPWLAQPDSHVFPAVTPNRSLVFDAPLATKLVKWLTMAAVACCTTKDLFRAWRLSLLGGNIAPVANDLRTLAGGGKRSQLLLVRDPVNTTVMIAAGYHRLCAVFEPDRDTPSHTRSADCQPSPLRPPASSSSSPRRNSACRTHR
jgi:hypothetical protein